MFLCELYQRLDSSLPLNIYEHDCSVRWNVFARPDYTCTVQGLINTNRVLADIIGTKREQFSDAQTGCSGEKK